MPLLHKYLQEVINQTPIELTNKADNTTLSFVHRVSSPQVKLFVPSLKIEATILLLITSFKMSF
jgi:hypothetical protein